MKPLQFLPFRNIFVLAAFISICGQSFSQNARFSAVNYSVKEYGNDRDVQIWAVVQDQRGVLYFGNTNGVLEFDSKNWRFIPCVPGSNVSALAVGDDGTIYVGTQYGFGYIKSNEKGSLVYTSISDTLLNNFFSTRVNKINVSGNTVWFQTEEAIFELKNGKVKVILPQTSFHLSFAVNGKLMVREREKGIMVINGDKAELIPGSEIFAGFGVFGIIPLNQQGDLLIITQELGIWKYVSGKFFEIKNEDEKILKSCQVYGAYKLKNGKIALSTLSAGVVVIDENAKIKDVVSISNSPMKVNDIKDLLEDRQGNLWLATSNGITEVYYSSPLTFYGAESGILNNIYAVSEYIGRIFAGTSNGLMVENNGFKPVQNITREVWELLVVGDELIIAGNESLRRLKSDVIEEIQAGNFRSLSYLPEKKLLFAGGASGVEIFEKTVSGWIHLLHVDEIMSEIIDIAWEKQKAGGFNVWCGTSISGVYKMSFSDQKTIKVTNYDTSDALPPGFVSPFQVNGKVYFGTNTGLMRFVSEEEVAASLADSLKNREDLTKGFFENYSLNKWGTERPVPALIEKNGVIFISETDKIVMLKGNQVVTKPFAGIESGKIRCFYFDGKSVCWIGTDDALIRFDLNRWQDRNIPFQTLIRSFGSKGDSLLYEGYFKGKKDFELKFSQNSITIDFASAWFTQPEKTTYSYFLEGYDEKWSEWTPETKVTYTNLNAGKYTFHVKARNVYGEEGKEETCTFTISPPWYRTVLAYIIYAILAILIIYGAIQVSVYRIKQKNIKLEKIVQERTAEIAQKNIVLQKQKEEIEVEKAKSEDLLLNTLPLKVVNDLKVFGKTEPESFEHVTVYFSDIKGFTDMSTGLDPKYLIGKLNEMFTAFDDIMTKYHCERIKTIGDAYMAVCGMPERNESHAELIMRASIDILKYLEERNHNDELKIQIRIGLNSGKLTGGVVGVRKYIYDVFGDTVNTASRMESNGEAMRINVSESTYLLLKDKFRFTERPPLEVKGKGVMKMFFLESEI